MSLVKLGLISEGIHTWPLYVAQARRLFEREGIEVQTTVTGSSVKQQEGLLRGDYDIGVQQADHVVRAVEQGADLFIFMAQGRAAELTLVGAPEVRGIEHLGGRPIAVDGARSGYALLLRRLLLQHGVAESDLDFREVGGSQERFEAMKSGAASASMLNSPFDSNLIEAGYWSLARMNDAFPDYPGAVMAARRSWASAHEAEVIAFVRAMDAAYKWLQDPSNRGDAMSLLPSRLSVAPRAAVAAVGKFAQRPRPQITEAGLLQVIDVVWEAEAYAQPKPDPAKYLDLSFAERALGAA